MRSPSYPKGKKVYHRMSDREFIHEIYELGGTPIEVMQDEVIRNTFFCPFLRADIQVLETYLESERNVADRKLACDMSVLYGFHDKTMSDKIHSWNRYTHGRTEFKGFEGDHFFHRE
ncbi:thioesterase II family protein [Paenibacillus rhizoplanae]